MALSPGNHGVIIIHGMVDKLKPGELLADFANHLADSLLESPTKDGVYPAIEREADLAADPPSVTLRIKSPLGEEATWICKEAFWADAFPPPKASTVLWWLLGQNIGAQFRYIWDNFTNDPANNETYMPDFRERQEKRSWTAGKGLSSRSRLKINTVHLTILTVLAVFT